MLLSMLSAAYLYSQMANPIYKCVNESEQISFSQTPCKRGDKATVMKQPGQRQQSSTGVPVIDQARAARSLPPALIGACADEVTNLKVKTDQDMYSLADQYKTQISSRERIARQLSEAAASKVGQDWEAELSEQRTRVEAEITNIETVARQIVEAEAAKYNEIRGRCASNAKS